MKRVVTSGDLTQRAMRPSSLHDAYVERVRADIARFELLRNAVERRCPACGGDGDPEFVRLDFSYRRCRGCRSLFVSPLPDGARLARYHAESDAERFRRDEMLPAIADVRAKHALSPRAHWVLGSGVARLGAPLALGYVGAASNQLVELLRASASVVRVVQQLSDATAAGSLDGIMAFDVLERSAEFAPVLHRCRAALKPGGLLFVTTMSGDGFEVRMLGERTQSLIPPLHLQLLSKPGWERALAREGLELLEYSTPGELDVEAVAEACRRHPDARLPPILDELVRHEDEQVGRAFQQLLQQAGLSSHVQLVAEAAPAPTTR
jgi:hypothetical protein